MEIYNEHHTRTNIDHANMSGDASALQASSVTSSHNQMGGVVVVPPPSAPSSSTPTPAAGMPSAIGTTPTNHHTAAMARSSASNSRNLPLLSYPSARNGNPSSSPNDIGGSGGVGGMSQMGLLHSSGGSHAGLGPGRAGSGFVSSTGGQSTIAKNTSSLCSVGADTSPVTATHHTHNHHPPANVNDSLSDPKAGATSASPSPPHPGSGSSIVRMGSGGSGRRSSVSSHSPIKAGTSADVSSIHSESVGLRANPALLHGGGEGPSTPATGSHHPNHSNSSRGLLTPLRTTYGGVSSSLTLDVGGASGDLLGHTVKPSSPAHPMKATHPTDRLSAVSDTAAAAVASSAPLGGGSTDTSIAPTLGHPPQTSTSTASGLHGTSTCNVSALTSASASTTTNPWINSANAGTPVEEPPSGGTTAAAAAAAGSASLGSLVPGKLEESTQFMMRHPMLRKKAMAQQKDSLSGGGLLPGVGLFSNNSATSSRPGTTNMTSGNRSNTSLLSVSSSLAGSQSTMMKGSSFVALPTGVSSRLHRPATNSSGNATTTNSAALTEAMMMTIAAPPLNHDASLNTLTSMNSNATLGSQRPSINYNVGSSGVRSAALAGSSGTLPTGGGIGGACGSLPAPQQPSARSDTPTRLTGSSGVGGSHRIESLAPTTTALDASPLGVAATVLLRSSGSTSIPSLSPSSSFSAPGAAVGGGASESVPGSAPMSQNPRGQRDHHAAATRSLNVSQPNASPNASPSPRSGRLLRQASANLSSLPVPFLGSPAPVAGVEGTTSASSGSAALWQNNVLSSSVPPTVSLKHPSGSPPNPTSSSLGTAGVQNSAGGGGRFRGSWLSVGLGASVDGGGRHPATSLSHHGTGSLDSVSNPTISSHAAGSSALGTAQSSATTFPVPLLGVNMNNNNSPARGGHRGSASSGELTSNTNLPSSSQYSQATRDGSFTSRPFCSLLQGEAEEASGMLFSKRRTAAAGSGPMKRSATETGFEERWDIPSHAASVSSSNWTARRHTSTHAFASASSLAPVNSWVKLVEAERELPQNEQKSFTTTHNTNYNTNNNNSNSSSGLKLMTAQANSTSNEGVVGKGPSSPLTAIQRYLSSSSGEGSPSTPAKPPPSPSHTVTTTDAKEGSRVPSLPLVRSSGTGSQPTAARSPSAPPSASRSSNDRKNENLHAKTEMLSSGVANEPHRNEVIDTTERKASEAGASAAEPTAMPQGVFVPFAPNMENSAVSYCRLSASSISHWQGSSPTIQEANTSPKSHSESTTSLPNHRGGRGLQALVQESGEQPRGTDAAPLPSGEEAENKVESRWLRGMDPPLSMRPQPFTTTPPLRQPHSAPPRGDNHLPREDDATGNLCGDNGSLATPPSPGRGETSCPALVGQTSGSSAEPTGRKTKWGVSARSPIGNSGLAPPPALSLPSALSASPSKSTLTPTASMMGPPPEWDTAGVASSVKNVATDSGGGAVMCGSDFTSRYLSSFSTGELPLTMTTTASKSESLLKPMTANSGAVVTPIPSLVQTKTAKRIESRQSSSSRRNAQKASGTRNRTRGRTRSPACGKERSSSANTIRRDSTNTMASSKSTHSELMMGGRSTSPEDTSSATHHTTDTSSKQTRSRHSPKNSSQRSGSEARGFSSGPYRHGSRKSNESSPTAAPVFSFSGSHAADPSSEPPCANDALVRSTIETTRKDIGSGVVASCGVAGGSPNTGASPTCCTAGRMSGIASSGSNVLPPESATDTPVAATSTRPEMEEGRSSAIAAHRQKKRPPSLFAVSFLTSPPLGSALTPESAPNPIQASGEWTVGLAPQSSGVGVVSAEEVGSTLAQRTMVSTPLVWSNRGHSTSASVMPPHCAQSPAQGAMPLTTATDLVGATSMSMPYPLPLEAGRLSLLEGGNSGAASTALQTTAPQDSHLLRHPSPRRPANESAPYMLDPSMESGSAVLTMPGENFHSVCAPNIHCSGNTSVHGLEAGWQQLMTYISPTSGVPNSKQLSNGPVTPLMADGGTLSSKKIREMRVQLSEDRKTLLAGPFQVSREGCLTVENFLLLNPRSIKGSPQSQWMFASQLNSGGGGIMGHVSTTAAAGSPRAALGSPLLKPQATLSPPRTEPYGSDGALLAGGVSRGAHLRGGLHPTTSSQREPPNGGELLHNRTVGSSTSVGMPPISSQRENHSNGHLQTPVMNLGGFSGHGGLRTSSSFTLQSTSMDTPYSPITYSLDCPQKFPTGNHRSSEHLLRALREDETGGSGGGGGLGQRSLPPGSSSNMTESHATMNDGSGNQRYTLRSMLNVRQHFSPKFSTKVTSSMPDHHHDNEGLNGGDPNTSTNNLMPGSAPLPRNSVVGIIHPMAGCPPSMVSPTTSPCCLPLTPTRLVSPVMVPEACPGSPHFVSFGLGGTLSQRNSFLDDMAASSTAGSLLLPYVDIPKKALSHEICAVKTLPRNAVRYNDLELAIPVGTGASASVFVSIHKPTGRRLAVKHIDLSPLCLHLMHKPTTSRPGSPESDVGGGGWADNLFGWSASPAAAPLGERARQLEMICVRELQVLHLAYRSPFMVKVYNAFFIEDPMSLDIVMEFMHYGSLDHLAASLQAHEAGQQGVRKGLEPEPQAGTNSPSAEEQPHPPETALTRPHASVASHPFSTEQTRATHGSRLCMDEPQPVADGCGLPPLNGPRSNTSDGRSGGSFPRHQPQRPTTGHPLTTTTTNNATSRKNKCGHQPTSPQSSTTALRYGGMHQSPLPVETSSSSREALRDTLPEALDMLAWSDTVSGLGGSWGLQANPSDSSCEVNEDTDERPLLSKTQGPAQNASPTGSSTVLRPPSTIVAETKGVNERLVAVVGEQLLRGVRDMHDRAFIHRDIKPGNVLVNEHGVVKLSDFGLSQRCGKQERELAPRPQGTGSRTEFPSSQPAQKSVWGNTGSSQPRVGTPPPHPMSLSHPNNNNSNSNSNSGGFTTNPTTGKRQAPPFLMVNPASAGPSPLVSPHYHHLSGARAGVPTEDSAGGTSDSDEAHCSGTDRYMSPERQRGEPHGKASDIWAVGVTLAEFAVGEYPYNLSGCTDAFERGSRTSKSLDLHRFSAARNVPLSEAFMDFVQRATLPQPALRPTAKALLEHPFFRQWDSPFNLKEYLAERVEVPSNAIKEEYMRKLALEGAQQPR